MRNYFENEQARINDSYFNADGFADENFYGDSYVGENASFYGDSFPADGASIAPAAVSTSQPYIFSIANSASVAVSGVVILGANQNTTSTSTNFGNPAAITITMLNANVSYAQFLQALKSTSFQVGMIYMQSSNTTQPFTTLTVSQTELNGNTSQLVYQPALNPDQQQNTVSTMKVRLNVNAFTQLSIQIEANATLQLRLYPQELIDVSRAMIGQSASRQFKNPNITGTRFISAK